MSVITSHLSERQEMSLLSLFDHVKLHLLFKASVHGYEASTFHRYCDYQGPTVIVAYNKAGFVFGAYTANDYTQSGDEVSDDRAFLYFIDPRRPSLKQRVASVDGQYGFTDGETGPDFGALVFLHNDTATVELNPGIKYKFDAGKMCGNDHHLTEFEVYRVEDLGNHLVKPWRNVSWSWKQQLIQTIQTYKPDVPSVSQARVLLVGPVGAGKSSFFNSVNSVFRGNITCQAISGSRGPESLTSQFRTFTIKNKKGGEPLPFVLCDTMGLADDGQEDTGLNMEDFINICKGHIEDRYEFVPSQPLQADGRGYRKHASLKEQVHCVVYVIDTCSASFLSSSTLEKLAAIRKKTNQMGIPQLVLMTNVDKCPLVAEDIKKIYNSQYIKSKAQELSVSLGIPLSCILPVKNYSQELELNPDMDILLLSALEQMLNYADNFFDNQVEPEPEKPITRIIYTNAITNCTLDF